MTNESKTVSVPISTADGILLDWMVAQCQNVQLTQALNWIAITRHYGYLQLRKGGAYAPSDDPTYSWPIIDKDEIDVLKYEGVWHAVKGFGHDDRKDQEGPTGLIAAMRCYVGYLKGNTFEVPFELVALYEELRSQGWRNGRITQA